MSAGDQVFRDWALGDSMKVSEVIFRQLQEIIGVFVP